MIFFPTVGADPLSDGIKAAATIRAEDRCDGESRLFLSGNIFHKDCVDAVSAFLNLSIIFIIIDPPGSDGHVHLVSFQPEFVQAEAIGIGHLRISATVHPAFRRIAGQILRFFRQGPPYEPRYQLSLKFYKENFLSYFSIVLVIFRLELVHLSNEICFMPSRSKTAQKSCNLPPDNRHTTSQQCHHKLLNSMDGAARKLVNIL